MCIRDRDKYTRVEASDKLRWIDFIILYQLVSLFVLVIIHCCPWILQKLKSPLRDRGETENHSEAKTEYDDWDHLWVMTFFGTKLKSKHFQNPSAGHCPSEIAIVEQPLVAWDSAAMP